MKATAVAPANIAFIKYWGKRASGLRLPMNDSISMNLSGAVTTTTVSFEPALSRDDISFLDESSSEKEQQRITAHLDRIRRLAKKQTYARVVTNNSFPKSTGIASSASGFAALTVAAMAAAGVQYPEKELSILARIGSGSACRSIPDGFVWWHAGKTSGRSYAESLYPPAWWDVSDVLCIVSKEAKKISTTDGMDMVRTSPYLKMRIRGIPDKIRRTQLAIEKKDIDTLGNIIEEDAISMHCVMMTQRPPLFYWNDVTMLVIRETYALRADGIAAYFTMDAGPNVHVICRSEDAEQVREHMQLVPGVQQVLTNTVSQGTHLVSHHLF